MGLQRNMSIQSTFPYSSILMIRLGLFITSNVRKEGNASTTLAGRAHFFPMTSTKRSGWPFQLVGTQSTNRRQSVEMCLLLYSHPLSKLLLVLVNILSGVGAPDLVVRGRRVESRHLLNYVFLQPLPPLGSARSLRSTGPSYVLRRRSVVCHQRLR